MTTTEIKNPIYYDYTDLTQEEWRDKIANSEVNNYTFINGWTCVHVLNGVAYIKQYDGVSRSVSTTEVREDR
jgi:hypothetical protein